MNRRTFLKYLGFGAVAAAVNPVKLIEGLEPEVETYKLENGTLVELKATSNNKYTMCMKFDEVDRW